MSSHRLYKTDQEPGKQSLSEAFKTILEQTCVQELDRGETYFNRASVKASQDKIADESLSNNALYDHARFHQHRKLYGRKKSRAYMLSAAIVQGLDISEIKKFGISDDVNIPDEYGKTPLHCAATSQNNEAVSFLLDRKVNVNVLDDRGETPLHAAVRTGNVALVNMLLQSPKIDVNLCGSLSKTTPLHLVTQIEHPNNTTICKLLIIHDADVFLRDSHNKLAIAYAAQMGNHDIMKCFLKNVPAAGENMDKLLYNVDDAESSLLHLAVSSRSLQAVQLCMENGAQVHKIKPSDGKTAVHLACALGPVEMLTMILKSCSYIYDYSMADKNGLTCLHIAAKYDQADIIALLLNQQIDINILDRNGKTPLMWAVSRGCNEATEVLLRNGADLSLLDKRDRTVIHLAIGNHMTLKLLLKHKIDLLKHKDKTGLTVLHYAAKGGYPLDVELILSKQNSLAGVQNVNEETPLHLAVSHGWINIVQLLLDGENSHMVNTLDKNERTPLHLAAKNSHADIVEFLLQNGASLQRDSHGQTPLHLAAKGGSLHIVERILADNLFCLNLTDKNKETALHLAVQAGHANVVEYFISNKEQELTENTLNKNVLDMAIENNQKHIAMVLASNRRWQEMFKPPAKGCPSQMALLIEKMPEVAKRFLDRCITKEGRKDNPDYKITYDLHYLQGMPDYERCKPKNSLKPLYAMVKNKRLNCLQHPTSLSLINVKWYKYGLALVLLNQILSVLYLCIVIGLVSMLTDNPCFKAADKVQCTNATNSWDLEGDPSWPKRPAIKLYIHLKIALIVLSVIKLIKQFIEIYNQGWGYLTKISYLLDLALCITMMIFLLPENCSRCFGAGAVAACLAWFSLMSRIARVSFMGVYLMMLEKIIFTVIRVFVLLFFFLLCFAFSFYVLDFQQVLFDNLSQSLTTTFVMLMGEVNYSVIFLEDDNLYHPFLLYPVFILFCLGMPIIFLNLLGDSATDYSAINSAIPSALYLKVEQLYNIEQMFPRFIVKHWQVKTHVEYPNRPKTLARQIYDIIAGTLTTVGYEEHEMVNEVEKTIEEQEHRLKSISKKLGIQSGQLELMQEYMARIAEKIIGSKPGFEDDIVNDQSEA
ncbi:transient receptor potential cation channel subfamily A member 1-like [Actinia tenebrosa]|uniref:Transient receptor potential cation channel subfamily A member 1-like n=1 Tax=Actinia tenebrosa TaxID=6105 RepID=A0A6P8IY39_ACTTE|nr:transient receptor potential cation channel subfamily A member 1-like [Actinia tenebrosa]